MKVIDYFGNTEDGGAVIDLELHPKRIVDFKPFELGEYKKVTNFIDEKYPGITLEERLNLIDKLLFEEDK